MGQSRQVVRGNTVLVLGLMGEVLDCVVGIIHGIEPVALCGHPHDRMVPVIEQSTESVASQSISRESRSHGLVISIEIRTIEAVKAFLGRDPKKSPFVAFDGNTIVARQAHVDTEGLDGIVG